MGTRHLGVVDVMGRRRVPRPAARMMAFMGTLNTIKGRKISRKDAKKNRKDAKKNGRGG
jgi:hypothetical protein